jgi:hypothetical protein
MKLKNTFYLLIFVFYTSHAYSMLCLTKTRNIPQAKISLRRTLYSAYGKVKAVGLNKCREAYEENKQCDNPLCCKNIRDIEEHKTQFLKRIDEEEGRFNFVLRVQKSYNSLIKIERDIDWERNSLESKTYLLKNNTYLQISDL